LILAIYFPSDFLFYCFISISYELLCLDIFLDRVLIWIGKKLSFGAIREFAHFCTLRLFLIFMVCAPQSFLDKISSQWIFEAVINAQN